MARYSLSLAAIAGATLVAGQTTTVSLIAPQFTSIPLAGSVVGVANDVTTYAVACASGGAQAKTCAQISTQTIIQGPSTWEMNYSVGHPSNAEINDAKCFVDFPHNTAACSVTISESVNGAVISSVMTTQISAVKQVMIPVTITAGADKISGGSPGASSTATAPNTAPTTATAASTTMIVPGMSSAPAPSGSPSSPGSPSAPAPPASSPTPPGMPSSVPNSPGTGTPIPPPAMNSTLSPSVITTPTGSSAPSPSTTGGSSAGYQTTGSIVFAGLAAVVGILVVL